MQLTWPLSTEAIKAIAVIFVLILLAAWMVIRKVGQLPSSATWKSYIKGQGLALLLSLAGGGVTALAGNAFGPAHGRVAEHVQLIQYDSLDPSAHAVYEELDIDTEKYARATIYVKTLAPQNGAAMLLVYVDQAYDRGEKSEIRRLTSRPDAWSRLDLPIYYNHLSLVLTRPRLKGPPATSVKMLVYLSPR